MACAGGHDQGQGALHVHPDAGATTRLFQILCEELYQCSNPGPLQVAPAWLCAGILTIRMGLIKLYDLNFPGVHTACIASPTTNPLLTLAGAVHAQIEYHYYHQTNITVPKQMLSVLKGLTARDLRVFSVEPNYWWKNYAQEFLEFAYIQVSLSPCGINAVCTEGLHVLRGWRCCGPQGSTLTMQPLYISSHCAMAADTFTAAHIPCTSPRGLTGTCHCSRGKARAGPPHTPPMHARSYAGEQGGELGDRTRGALKEEAEQGRPELHQEDVCMSENPTAVRKAEAELWRPALHLIRDASDMADKHRMVAKMFFAM